MPNPDILQFREKEPALGLSQTVWRDALARTAVDPSVGIAHAKLDGDAAYRKHVAEIPDRVGCHFHKIGDEDYAVVQGQGVLHWGKAVEADNGFKVNWEQPVAVSEGDTFVIPEGYAHQLVRDGDTPLVIIFGCPDTHLDDEADRYMLPDADTKS